MKKILYLISLSLIAGMIFWVSCKNNSDEPSLTPQQERAQLLKGTWAATNVTVPSGVSTDVVSDLIMTFGTDSEYNPTTFSANNAPDFFTGSNGTWAFDGTSISSISLTNISPVNSFTINSVSETALSITFQFTDSGARIESLAGTYNVDLTKQ